MELEKQGFFNLPGVGSEFYITNGEEDVNVFVQAFTDGVWFDDDKLLIHIDNRWKYYTSVDILIVNLIQAKNTTHLRSIMNPNLEFKFFNKIFDVEYLEPAKVLLVSPKRKDLEWTVLAERDGVWKVYQPYVR